MTFQLPENCLTHMVGYAIFCGLLHTIIVSLFLPSLKSFSKETQNLFRNKFVSSVHAVIMFSRSVYYWVKQNPNMTYLPFISDFEAITIDIMMGYLIYDTLFEFQSAKFDFGALSHHIIGFLSHFMTRMHDNGPAAFYSMMIYLAELSTPFLNLSWLCKQLGPGYEHLLKLTAGVLVITFFFCRILLGPYLLYHMFMFWTGEPRYLFLINVFIILFFILLNFYWFSLLLKIILKKDKKEHTNHKSRSENKHESQEKDKSDKIHHNQIDKKDE